jgi:hypothetical protein
MSFILISTAILLDIVEACGRGAQTSSGQASPPPRLAPLYVTADAVRLCIYSASPLTSGSHVEDLNCDLLLTRILCRFCYLNAWQTCCAPRPSIPSFPAVERVTEPVSRVGVIRSHSETMPCDVLSSFPPSPNQAEYRFMAFFITLVCLVRKHIPARSYHGVSEKKASGRPFALICPYTSVTPSRRRLGVDEDVDDVPSLHGRHHCPPSSRPTEPINHTSLCPPSSTP